MVVAGLLGIGLSRTGGRPAPDPVDDQLVRLIDEERLLDAEADNPRGVRLFAPHPITGGQE
jgi:hypothetical protein